MKEIFNHDNPSSEVISSEKFEVSQYLREKINKLAPKLKQVRTWAMAALLSTAAIEGGTALKETADAGYFDKFPGFKGDKNKAEKVFEKGLALGQTELMVLIETFEDAQDILNQLGERDKVINPERQVKYTVKAGETLRQIATDYFANMEYQFDDDTSPDRKLNAYLNARHYARINNLSDNVDEPLPAGLEIILDDGAYTFGR